MKPRRTGLVNPCSVDPTARAEIDALVNEKHRSRTRKALYIWLVIFLSSVLAVGLSGRDDIGEGAKIALGIVGWGGIIAFAAYLSTFRAFRGFYSGPDPGP